MENCRTLLLEGHERGRDQHHRVLPHLPESQSGAASRPLPAVSEPFERVAWDITGPLMEIDDGFKYVLVVTDYLTQWAEIYPLKSVTARSVASRLLEFICQHLAPMVILADRARYFRGRVVKRLCTLFGTLRSFTSP